MSFAKKIKASRALAPNKGLVSDLVIHGDFMEISWGLSGDFMIFLVIW
jgi:hypothetical protein